MSFDLVIAVDGPAASGKGTVASRLARHYGLPHLDTGLLYRAVGVGALKQHGVIDEAGAERVAAHITPAHLNEQDLMTRAAGELASQVAVFPGVRAALLKYQRDFAAKKGGAVLDGRDIGTVIAPHAPAKLFVTATPEVRAERRWKQLSGQGEGVSLEEVLADIKRRDERDSGRDAAPLVQAADAALLDTSQLTIEAAFREACRLVEQVRGSSKG